MNIQRFRDTFEGIRREAGKILLGQDEIIESTLIAILAGGHVLIEGVPGLGKTLLVRTLAHVIGAGFRRIQFTPDLMPSDVTGGNVFDQKQDRFVFHEGPVFTQLLLADEINRAPAKTQSALLEAMQDLAVTTDGVTRPLPEPFLVIATQNPVESQGTYPLPEAQLDRFFFKLHVPFPGRDELHSILDRTTGMEAPEARPVVNRQRLLAMQKLVREVPVARHVQDYAVRLLQATHPADKSLDQVKRFVKFGSSPRGAQAILLAAKIRALFEGRFSASTDDVKAVALPALRHRVLLNFEGEAEGVKTDDVLLAIIKQLPDTEK